MLIVALGLVVCGALLALTEAVIRRMTPGRIQELREEGRRGTSLLEAIEARAGYFLDGLHLASMLTQAAVVVAVLSAAQGAWGDPLAAALAVGFTLLYFVVVAALPQALVARLPSGLAMALVPLGWGIGGTFAPLARLLRWLGGAILPGQRHDKGALATIDEIRSMAEVGHQEGSIESHEKHIIDSVLELGGRVVREVMVPRPDIISVRVDAPLDEAAALIVKHGMTRLPAYRGDLDSTEGMVHAKDVLRRLYEDRRALGLQELLRPVRFVPESKRLPELLREMQQERFHLAMVSDEYGSVTGMVTLEDLLEELVGQITDEHDREAPDLVRLDEARYRVNAALPIGELNEALGVDLPHESWNTIGGLVFGLAGRIPEGGTEVELAGLKFTVERVQGRRILTVLVTRIDLPTVH